eukprot:CAMPEP_0196718526 /NCGR_PEP_ID=MMETSP1091-20130531/1706_1 /TAXON_ID=302021 /ORGANISM="Rhodomonas sp., Strain CCMP768" /LENGTH=114 /DNA_ID=CAMNT_0042059199 /DNA_START=46 /DNA_END=390 /DNA_ORIENTATION=+
MKAVTTCITLLAIIAIAMGETFAGTGVQGSTRVSRPLRRPERDSVGDSARYPSPTGRGNSWRFDLRHVGESTPAFVAPPAPGFDFSHSAGGLRNSMEFSGRSAPLRTGSEGSTV